MKEYTYQWNSDWNEDEPILKITKSSLGTFDWCKKQYEFSYIDRLPQDSSDAMIKGSIVHNAYEDFFNEVDIKKASDLSEPQLENYFTELFPIDDYGETYDSIISYETQRYLMNPDLFMPAANEIVLDAEWVVDSNINPKYPLSRNYTVHLQGIIDRVFVEGDSVIPMELKTGVWKDSKLSRMRGEMAYYKLLMEESDLDLGNITHWGWFYPDSNYSYVEETKKATETALKKRFAKLIHAYEQKNFPASYFYKKCIHCSYMGICDDAIERQLTEEW